MLVVEEAAAVQAPASQAPEGHPQLFEKLHHHRLTIRPVLVGDPYWSGGTWGDGSTPEKATPSDTNMYKQSLLLRAVICPDWSHRRHRMHSLALRDLLEVCWGRLVNRSLSSKESAMQARVIPFVVLRARAAAHNQLLQHQRVSRP